MIEDKINIAKAVSAEIEGILGVNSASVDDYNKYGEFQIVVYLDLDKNKKPLKKDFNLTTIRRNIKRILKNTKQVSKFGNSIETPKREYDKFTYRGRTECTFKGYERSYIMVDFTITLPNEQVSIIDLLL